MQSPEPLAYWGQPPLQDISLRAGSHPRTGHSPNILSRHLEVQTAGLGITLTSRAGLGKTVTGRERHLLAGGVFWASNFTNAIRKTSHLQKRSVSKLEGADWKRRIKPQTQIQISDPWQERWRKAGSQGALSSQLYWSLWQGWPTLWAGWGCSSPNTDPHRWILLRPNSTLKLQFGLLQAANHYQRLPHRNFTHLDITY